MCSHIPNRGERMVRYYGYSNVSRENARRKRRLSGSSTARTASLSERFLGRDWRLGANPCSIAIPPSNPDGPVVLDMATSAVAAGKIEVAMARKEHVVPGWIIDKLSGIENILGKP
ncbi:MAG: Ldh family oxidoreductase [Nanoarchaeota archaeon]|nr:Ldh family oxidoreductase [Nanoarchaeota archaeon]